MSARQKKKRASEGVRPDWWEWPTFYTRESCTYRPEKKLVLVDLVLPDGTKVDLGRFTDTGNPDILRLAVGERFREIWDPKKFCQRTPKT